MKKHEQREFEEHAANSHMYLQGIKVSLSIYAHFVATTLIESAQPWLALEFGGTRFLLDNFVSRWWRREGTFLVGDEKAGDGRRRQS